MINQIQATVIGALHSPGAIVPAFVVGVLAAAIIGFAIGVRDAFR